MIWLTADQHFSHEKIIDYCNRPFIGVNNMNNEIIRRYRSVVKEEDTVYMLGDLTIVGPQHRAHLDHITKQLPGRKILILGSHDKFDPFAYWDFGFESVHTVLDIGEYVLVHDPAISMVKPDRKWCCGHIHTLFKKQKNVINVGVDQWGFYPVSIEEINKLWEAV